MIVWCSAMHPKLIYDPKSTKEIHRNLANITGLSPVTKATYHSLSNSGYVVLRYSKSPDSTNVGANGNRTIGKIIED